MKDRFPKHSGGIIPRRRLQVTRFEPMYFLSLKRELVFQSDQDCNKSRDQTIKHSFNIFVGKESIRMKTSLVERKSGKFK